MKCTVFIVILVLLLCAEIHNTTAENIAIPAFLPPLPTLRDVLGPRVGDKLLQTDNQFQQELLLGSELVHQGDEDRFLIGPGVFYKKNVRKEVPPVTVQPRCAVDKAQGSAVTLRRGMRRWTALPDVAEVCQRSLKLPTQPFYGHSGTTRVNRCQKKASSGLYGAREADTPTIWVDATPSGPISNPPPSIPQFFLHRMSFLLQPSQFIVAWDMQRIMLDCIPPWLG